MKKSISGAPAKLAGTVDEDTFVKAFEDVPALETTTTTVEILKHIRDTISDSTKDWSTRQKALKKIRSLLLAGANNNGDFHLLLKPLELPLQTCLKDLRSQVVREACISIAFLAVNLRSKFDKTAEFLLPQLMNLMQNSAKVVSTAGRTTVRFMIKTSQNPRMITLLTSYTLSSKSKDIRRCSYEFLAQILNQWPPQYLEKHIKLLQEAIRRGIADADQDARSFSREAFQGFRDHFPDRSEILVQSLDINQRKVLLGDSCVSANPLLSRSTSTLGTSKLSNVTDAPRRGGLFTRSAIDEQAAQRAKARSEYAALSRCKITAAANIQRNSSEGSVAVHQERLARSKNKSSQAARNTTEGTVPKPSEKPGPSKNRPSQSRE